MYGLIARVLEVMYSIWPSYGGAIVLLTLVVMLVLAPLTLKGTRSMLAMQALQPEIRRLQNRYKNDRAKLNEETMKFYQEHKINPLSGCLPLLIQLPVFFILYQVLLGLTRRAPYGQDLGSAIGCHVANATGCVNNVYTSAGFFNPKYLDLNSGLGQSLSSTREMLSWGLDLSQSPMAAMGNGLVHALPYIGMVLVVIALTYIQQIQIQSRTPKNSNTNPTQQMMMKVMPVVMGVIYLVIPAGVVVYFLVSSLFRIGQQGIVTRSFAASGLGEKLVAEMDEELDPSPKPRLRDMFQPPATDDGAASSPNKNTAKAKSGGGAGAGAGAGAKKKTGTAQQAKKKPAGAKAAPAASKAKAKASNDKQNDPVADNAEVKRPKRTAAAKKPSRQAPTGPNAKKK